MFALVRILHMDTLISSGVYFSFKISSLGNFYYRVLHLSNFS